MGFGNRDVNGVSLFASFEDCMFGRAQRPMTPEEEESAKEFAEALPGNTTRSGG